MYEDLVSQIIESDGKSTVNIKIKPSASKTKLIYKKGLYATVKSDPEKGRANQELVALLKKEFQIPKHQVWDRLLQNKHYM